MSAEVLRRAAAEMRRDAMNGQTDDAPFMEAVADWLDREAARCTLRCGTYIYPDMGDADPAALAVARAYLEES